MTSLPHCLIVNSFFSEKSMTEMISLGGRDFTLRPPTLGQLRHLLDALDEMAGASGGALIDAAAKLVAAGEIFRYWEANPPPYLLLQAIARLLGWQPSRTQSQSSIDALAQLAAAPPPGLAVRPAAAIGMPPPILDPAALRARQKAQE